jgi:major membrane immunogen (membrane-anchored lipoprotein)
VAPAASAPHSLSPSIVSAYKDGTYDYTGKPDAEGYHAEGTMKVSGGKIQSMEWRIVDSAGRVFDDKYEEVYKGNDTYIQQCRDNWKGLQDFVPKLLDKQDPEGVDAISGATWAYRKFDEAASALLKQAE